MGCRDVSNLIPVVDVLSGGRKDGLWMEKKCCKYTTKAVTCSKKCKTSNLEGLDRRDAAVRLTLVIVAGKGTLEDGSCVSQVNGFLHGDIAPMRHLNSADNAGDGEKRCVVLVMDLHCILNI